MVSLVQPTFFRVKAIFYIWEWAFLLLNLEHRALIPFHHYYLFQVKQLIDQVYGFFSFYYVIQLFFIFYLSMEGSKSKVRVFLYFNAF
jgi:hypothetical protein